MDQECNFLVILKPDSVKRSLVGTIISNYEGMGFELKNISKQLISREYIKFLYGHLPEEIFEKNCDFMTSGECVVSIWSGNVLVAKKLAGETKPLQRDYSSIRGRYSNSLRFNLIHCSDSVESAKKEVDYTAEKIFGNKNNCD